MLCQEKKSDERPARSSVVAACGERNRPHDLACIGMLDSHHRKSPLQSLGKSVLIPRWFTWIFAGIYIRDLLEAVPVDKYFELFQPSALRDG